MKASRPRPRFSKHHRPASRRLLLETLENRALLAGFVGTPNDPEYPQQWLLNNTGQTGGAFDADIDAPGAWAISTGSMDTVVAVLDDGIDYKRPDIYLNIWLNTGEIPAGVAALLSDADSDGVITFRDLNAPANASAVSDTNSNGYIDGGDLLSDPQWSDGIDQDGNARTDDLIGWDFHNNDNDPMNSGPVHGSDMAALIGAVGNDGIGKAGVSWAVRLMPVRIQSGGAQNNRNIIDAVAGLDYAVVQGAQISNNSWGDGTYSQAMYDAIDHARQAGHLFVAAAGNNAQDMDANPFYPAGYDLDNIVSAAATDAFDQLSSATNYGLTSVDLGAPSPAGGTSGAAAYTSGVAALVKSVHPEWDYAPIKDRLLASVDPVLALAGRSVSGGRANAAHALAATNISISDPSAFEGAAGTTLLAFTVTRHGDDSGAVTLDWSTADGTATAASDYAAASGQITFTAGGPNSQSLVINIVGDAVQEPDETFFIQLTLVSGDATLADAAGQGTIWTDDVQLSINDVSATEGSGTPHYRGPFVEGAPTNHFTPVTFGPGGHLYTSTGAGPGGGSIRRYHGTTGEFIDTFVPAGRIDGVRDIVFRGAYVYVGSEYSDEVLRFDANSGVFVDAFVTAGSGGIDGPHGLAFGPDANSDGVPELYVSGRNSQNVVRYDGATGQPLGTFVTAGSGGLSWPEGLTFDASGVYAFVASTGSSRILKYNAQTGAYVGIGASTGLSSPKDVKFGLEGLMYVTSGGNDRVLRFTAGGVYVDDYVTAGSGGIDNPSRVAFGADGDLYVTATGNSQILRYGTESEAILTVSLSSASTQPVTVDFASSNGSATAGSDYTATSGTVTFSPGTTTRLIRIPTLDDALYEGNETFVVNLSNSVGGVIADGQGVGTIIDNDPQPTKFYVVNDGSPDRTYEYGDDGAAIDNYAVNGANSAPRGAASTIAGDKVWVVDANRKVYVYNTSGGLLGSWTAGTLAASATPEGIATNGTDVWIVDAKSDKVFKYTGAASRLSGSQNAASSFNLNSGNTGPKDIVTDGQHLWVVNDSTIDKVFKYTVAGSLVGSWTISGGGGSPTGITMDPGNVNDIWVVDSGTDTVYQYAAAASRISGSQGAVATFALAAGNTNPQGLADPPAEGIGNRVSGSGGRHSDSLTAAAIDAAIVDVAEMPSRSRKAATDVGLPESSAGSRTVLLAVALNDNADDESETHRGVARTPRSLRELDMCFDAWGLLS